MKPGIYRDKDGKSVVVARTEGGYVLRYSDGTTVAVKR